MFIPERDRKRLFFEEYIEEKPTRHIYASCGPRIDSKLRRRPLTGISRKRRDKTPA